MERRNIMYLKKKLCDVINRVAETYRKEQSLRKSKLSVRDTIQIIIGTVRFTVSTTQTKEDKQKRHIFLQVPNVNLHGKSDCFAEQEMYAAMTMFNFTSRIAREAVIRQPERGIHAYRVNFKMAAALCREYFRTEDADYEKLLAEIGRHTVPIRPDRQNKRDLKSKGFVGFSYRVSS